MSDRARQSLRAALRWLALAGRTLARWTLALCRELLVNVAALAMWLADLCSDAVAQLDSGRPE